MNQLKIRPTTESDWPKLEHIFYSNRPEGTEWLSPTRPQDDLREQSEGEKILVAETAGKVVGFVAVWEPENFVHHLYVDREFQRQGVGKELVLAVQRTFPGPIRLKCGERNTAALAFYLSSGWKEVDRGVSDDGPYMLLELPSVEPTAGSDPAR